jgi:DNA-binding MarR family transcriptional regulator
MAEQNYSTIKLTFRQKAFLSKVLDIYREMKKPIHYTVIASKLGLSKSTTYDMLRVLEQRGMVSSQYSIPKEISGPGRASIMFYPTASAKEFLSRLAGEVSEQEGWENVKARILASLRHRKAKNYREFLEELLENIPEVKSPLEQCAQIITALLLSLREAKFAFTDQSSINAIVMAPVSKVRMSILAGLVMGFSLSNNKVKTILENYRIYTDKYGEALLKLNKEGLVALHKFTREAWGILNTEPLH